MLDLPNELLNGTLADAIDVQENIDYLSKVTGAPVQGFGYNYQIVPTVTSNNLKLSLKTLAGTDPSVDNPVYVRIGNAIRKVTSALFTTKNAGTNWMNAGSAELATKEIDYFAYLGYNATDGVVLGFSRIPYANQYSDFSVTTTNEKYAAISTITNAAATDYYEVIGRFAATLGVSATYLWTVPTFTAINLINRPIFETRTLSYTPVSTGFSVAPTVNLAVYKIFSGTMSFGVNLINGTSNATTFTYTLPMSPSQNYQQPYRIVNAGAAATGLWANAASTVSLFATIAAGVFTASGTKECYGSGVIPLN